jgi:glyoxylate/hydroxypyruvate reductase A
MMKIIYYHPFFNAKAWLNGMKKRLPHADIRQWHEGDEAEASYALVWKPPYRMLAGRSGLKAIFALGAGVDAILQQQRETPDFIPPGVPLIRLENAGMARQMQEYATATVLRYFRRFDDYQQRQRLKKWEYLPPYGYEEFTVGVMGLGVLGSEVASQLANLGFTVKGWSQSKKQIAGVNTFKADELSSFLTGTKVIINLLPNTPKTVGILNKGLFEQLVKGAYIINIARGVHLVEDDLLAALNAGQLSAATLDVFAEEPLPQDHPFWLHPKITLTPHISALTLPDLAMDQISLKINALEQGETVDGIIDLTKGY